MGITTIGLTTPAEPETVADEPAFIHGSSLAETYLNADAIISLALRHGADAIHPGYGFLSENARFAEKTEQAGLLFIGPSASAIDQMGHKITAREIAASHNVPITQSLQGSVEELLAKSTSLPYPLLIKAAAGGGGKGMVKINHPDDLVEKLPQTAREAANYFGDGTIYVEQYIENPHHIEVQVLGDQHGHLVHLFERECSIQRRYQKIIEEAPSVNITPEKRQELTRDALRLCKAIGYYNAGTVEFLMDDAGHHYFLEMNTRLQVEHPVTESITGLDMVEHQLNIAMGLPLPFGQDDLAIHGHAIESRIYAEDPLHDFRPAPGHVAHVQWPSGDLARTDTWFSQAVDIRPDFDPMMAKIITHAPTREGAIAKQIKALEQTQLTGSINNIHYLSTVYHSNVFLEGRTTTGFCERHNYQPDLLIHPEIIAVAALLHRLLHKPKGDVVWHQLGFWRVAQSTALEVNNETFNIEWQAKGSSIQIVINHKNRYIIDDARLNTSQLFFSVAGEPFVLNWVFIPGEPLILESRPQVWTIQPVRVNPGNNASKNANQSASQIKAPIPGKIIEVRVQPGDLIAAGDSLVILEAMKMENHLNALHGGIVTKVLTSVGQQVKANDILIDIENSN
ncbi:biotin carboxylase of acetyl-CoA carboxylase [Geofilum rubicundum JCM 15548]|uniref:Biotin carboxylase of acetyl-CoA carboxylase n=2 Tax=Geofilum TaxID=1236988 RepID=A0A0E9M1Y8_9BACT|nr:biotin carboxylase of acetyl-CoA carboxylase [Geofilum rubicundum JCM 15548]